MTSRIPAFRLLASQIAIAVLLFPGLCMGLEMTAQVTTDAGTVHNGDVVVYRVNLKRNNTGGTNRVEVESLLTQPLRLAGRMSVDEIVPAIVTGDIQYRNGRDRDGQPTTWVRWRGQVEPDAELDLYLPVRVYSPCQSGNETERVSRVFHARHFDGNAVSATASFFVTCPQISLDDILVTVEMPMQDETDASDRQGAFHIRPILGQYPTGNLKQEMRISLTNQGQLRAIVGYRIETRAFDTDIGVGDSHDRQLRYIGETEKNITQVVLDPGQTRNFSIWTDMRPFQYQLGRPDSADHGSDSEFDDYQVEFDFQYMLLPFYEPGLQWDEDRSLRTQTVGRQFRYRPWDLGDAPDSSNHVGTQMSAYQGVTASFPTVFSPQASQVPGPAHARPHHFHLGRGVSREADADLGAHPNIDPAIDQADGDLHDDGANPHRWNLEHCRPTRFSVQVFISPEASEWFSEHQLKGYLNAWVDANRDGDWNDYVSCPADELPIPRVALEHFIIDHEIDVARLGPGYHRISVDTGRVPWPAAMADQPTWVRLTLSERPSAKVGTVGSTEFGDGRGHARPFMTGETEDYYLQPSGSPTAGADVSIALSGQARHATSTGESLQGLRFIVNKLEWNLVADFGNQGTATADQTRLHFDFPEGVSQQQIEAGIRVELVDHRNPGPKSFAVSDRRVTVDLGRIAVGERGRAVLSLVGDEWLIDGNIQASIEAVNDINPNNRTDTFRIKLEGVQLEDLGQSYTDISSPLTSRFGTTNRSEITLEGQGHDRFITQDGKIPVWIYGVMVGMGQKDAYREAEPDPDGRWSLTLTDLDDGFYQIAVGHPGACDVDPLGQPHHSLHGYGTVWGVVCGHKIVDTTLSVDPMSIVITDEAGRHFPVSNTFNWSRGDWGLRLPAGEYTVVMEFKDNIDDAYLRGASEITGFGSFETKLMETAIPGRYIGHFIIGDGGGMPTGLSERGNEIENGLTLFLVDNNDEFSFFGEIDLAEPGLVTDATSGQPIEGATATILVIAIHDEGTIALPWDGSAHGQANPVLTDADGRFLILEPGRPYHVEITADGYQTYRTPILNPTGGAYVAEHISLTPQTGSADYFIGTDMNGFVPALNMVAPDSVVRFINSDNEPLQIIGEGFDSGLLLMGESYSVQVGQNGLVLFEDSFNPARQGALLITSHNHGDIIFSDSFSSF